MAVLDINFTETLVAVKCAGCGVNFGMPADMKRRRQDDHKTFYCPNGHTNYWPQESEAERLQRQIKLTENSLRIEREEAARLRQRNTSLKRSRDANRGVVTRMKRRIAAGRCVCCSREFKDLERHMKNQHPNWDAEKHVAALEAKGASR